MRRAFIIMFILAVSALFLIPAAMGGSKDAPAGVMILSVPKGGKATKPPVEFAHAAHAALDCTACHHKYQGQGEISGCSAQGCHTDLKSRKGQGSFYAAFHASKSEVSCLGCHRTLAKAKKKAGPSACNKCHVKKAAAAEPAEAKDEEKPAAAPRTEPEMKVDSAKVGAGAARPRTMMAYAPPPEPMPGPPPVDREQYGEIDANPVKSAAQAPVSTFSIDVDTGAYSNVRRFLNQGVLPRKDAVRVEEMINYFTYDYPGPKDREIPFASSVEIGPSPWNDKTLLMRIGLKGYDIEKAERPAANLVFLLDVSGSMSDQNKLPLLKSAFKLLSKQLTAKDRVSIVVYAGAAGIVLEPTPGDKTAEIMAALDRLSAGGSTAGGAGIKLAYAAARQAFIKDGVNRILLATDGDFNVGTVDFNALIDMVERERKDGIMLTTLGFGMGNYNERLMEQLADKGNGAYAYIDTLNEANKVLVREMSSTLFPIAKDVKIQVEFNPAVVAEYRLIGYENRMLKREDFENDKVDAGEIGAGHSVTALYEIALVGSGGERLKPLRYGEKPQPAPGADKSDELCFLRLRYKLPDSDKSELIETPIKKQIILKELPETTDSFRFAAAVAAFGQILGGGRYTGEFGCDQVLDLASGARGQDRFGYRGEFLGLVSLAKGLGAN